MKQPPKESIVIQILSDRIKQMEIERAYMLCEITSLKQQLKEVETNGDKPVE